MKKTILPLALLLCCISMYAQKGPSGKGLQFGLMYSMPKRTQFDTYMATISHALGIDQTLIAKNDIGFAAGLSFRSGDTEVGVGGGIMLGHKTKISNTGGSVSATLNSTTFDIHFGVNKYLAGPFFIGSDFGVISNGGKFETVGMESLFETTSSNSNPFIGYSVMVKPKAGFFFSFKKGEFTGLRLNAFYDLGLSKYEFYKNNLFSTRLKDYTGETKTSYSGFGVDAILVFSLDK